MNTRGELENLRLTETPRALLKNWEKIRKFETDRNLRDSSQKLSRSWDWRKNFFIPSEGNGRGKPTLSVYSTVWAFSSRKAVEWLWGREYCMVWTLRMRTISPLWPWGKEEELLKDLKSGICFQLPENRQKVAPKNKRCPATCGWGYSRGNPIFSPVGLSVYAFSRFSI